MARSPGRVRRVARRTPHDRAAFAHASHGRKESPSLLTVCTPHAQRCLNLRLDKRIVGRAREARLILSSKKRKLGSQVAVQEVRSAQT